MTGRVALAAGLACAAWLGLTSSAQALTLTQDAGVSVNLEGWGSYPDPTSTEPTPPDASDYSNESDYNDAYDAYYAALDAYWYHQLNVSLSNMTLNVADPVYTTGPNGEFVRLDFQGGSADVSGDFGGALTLTPVAGGTSALFKYSYEELNGDRIYYQTQSVYDDVGNWIGYAPAPRFEGVSGGSNLDLWFDHAQLIVRANGDLDFTVFPAGGYDASLYIDYELTIDGTAYTATLVNYDYLDTNPDDYAYGNGAHLTAVAVPVPEPGSLALTALTVAGAIGRRRSRARA